MTAFYRFLVDPRGRTDRIGYALGLFGLIMWLLVLTTLVRARPGDFTGSGLLIDAVLNANAGEAGRLLMPHTSLHPAIMGLAAALYLLALWTFLSMTARRLQDMGRPGIYAAATLVIGMQGAVLLLAILPGDRAENLYGPAPRRRLQPGGEPGTTGPNTL